MRRFCTQIFLDIRSSLPLSFGSNSITLSQIQMTIKKDNFVQNAQPLSLLSYTIMTFSFPPKPFPAKPTHASTVHNTITQHPRIYIFSTFDTPKFQIEPLSLSLSLSSSVFRLSHGVVSETHRIRAEAPREHSSKRRNDGCS